MWEDILEALALGGSGAISGYQQAKELEAERANRERERMAEERYRQQLLGFEERQAALAERREDRAEREGRATRRLQAAAQGLRPASEEFAYGKMTEFGQGPQLMELQERFAPSAPPEIAPPSLVTAPGTMEGTGARVAPNQTNAVRQALEQASLEGPDTVSRTRRAAAPEGFRTPSAAERRQQVVDLGDGEIYTTDDPGLFGPTPEELQQQEIENELARLRATQGMKEDVQAQDYAAAIQAGFSPRDAFLISRGGSPAAPRRDETVSPIETLRESINDFTNRFITSTGNLPPKSDLDAYIIQQASLLGISPEQVSQFFGAGPGPDDGFGDQTVVEEDDILAGIRRRRAGQTEEFQRDLELRKELAEINEALQTNVYRGEALDDYAYRQLGARKVQLEMAGIQPAVSYRDR